jgi:hypothetical protein
VRNLLCWFDPEAAAEQIPHRFRFGKPQRKGFGMARILWWNYL